MTESFMDRFETSTLRFVVISFTNILQKSRTNNVHEWVLLNIIKEQNWISMLERGWVNQMKCHKSTHKE